MYAMEFETDVRGQYIKIPDYQKFKFKHVKVVLMTKETVEEPELKRYNFDDLVGNLNWNGNAVSIQRKMRNEW